MTTKFVRVGPFEGFLVFKGFKYSFLELLYIYFFFFVILQPRLGIAITICICVGVDRDVLYYIGVCVSSMIV